ncbi:MAG TPA: hypothetical protein PK244_09820 [Pseudomonadales bacterium]|nr:hypothetical protein [Pseudomonadales bacterium]
MKDAKEFLINGITITAPAALTFAKGKKELIVKYETLAGEKLYALPAGRRITESGILL